MERAQIDTVLGDDTLIISSVLNSGMAIKRGGGTCRKDGESSAG